MASRARAGQDAEGVLTPDADVVAEQTDIAPLGADVGVLAPLLIAANSVNVPVHLRILLSAEDKSPLVIPGLVHVSSPEEMKLPLSLHERSLTNSSELKRAALRSPLSAVGLTKILLLAAWN